ncbi:threonine synthase [Entophlyctis luteolus]|nr:threonine synthase [Entophlyctis luteolus]
MHYRSTRNTRPDIHAGALGFEDTVRTGLSPDGGLYVPTNIPLLFSYPENAKEWASLGYVDIAFVIFRHFIPSEEIPDNDLRLILEKSYSTFDDERVTPVVKLSEDPNIRILELWHGPTFAFKDVALQCLGNLFDYFLSRPQPPTSSAERSSRIAVLGATSGDTGGAAIYGLRGKRNVDVFIMHPKNRISPVQEQQMTSVLDPNVHNIAVDGATFDDCQEIVKVLMGDADFKKKYSLAAVNSINWARILAQTVYYFVSYLAVMKELGLEDEKDISKLPRIDFSVPTGNFGDILAAYYAKEMGLPLGKLIVATNANDILHRFLKTGVYEKPVSPTANASDAVSSTLSPAMDILVSSNFERVLWHFVRAENGGDHAAASKAVAEWMDALRRDGRFAVPPGVWARARATFASSAVSDADTLDAISRYWAQERYVLDPHTAVGVVAAEREGGTAISGATATGLTVVLATASPGKFPEAVFQAIPTGLKYEEFAPDPLVRQAGLPKRMTTVTMVGNDRDRAVADVRLKPTAFQSLAAGVIAGAIEGTITYPTEFVKTQLQLQGKSGGTQKFAGPIDVVRVTLRERGFFGLYRGLSALVLGTASKAGVRFLVFDQIKAALADKQGKVTGARMMLAGLGAGVMAREAIVAVTPTETIKTKLIQDQNQKNPRFKGLVHGTRIIFAEQGFKGLYQGVTTVIARQGANSAVRLSAYGLMREKLTEFYKTAPIPVYATFGIGAAAGVITVYTTMPLDVLKTKMQAEDARTRYRNTADCFVKTLREEGVLAFWKGATPRLGRLILHHAESLFLKTERNTMAKQRAARNGGDAGVAFSKALSYILRHGAAKEGIPMRTDGYVLVADLQRLHLQMRTKTLDDFKAVVAANDKQRFTLVRVADVDGAAHADDDAGEDVWMIKANQGHSLPHIEVELEEINNPGDLPVVVHGTYFRCLDSIKSQGLSKMNRNHIHFAVGKAGDLDVISGMRKSSQVLIYINVPLAMSGDSAPAFVCRSIVNSSDRAQTELSFTGQATT